MQPGRWEKWFQAHVHAMNPNLKPWFVCSDGFPEDGFASDRLESSCAWASASRYLTRRDEAFTASSCDRIRARRRLTETIYGQRHPLPLGGPSPAEAGDGPRGRERNAEGSPLRRP